ncbi:hypothetical protein D3C80_1347490 [compost metagenome]
MAASCMPSGSKAWTVAPLAIRAGATSSDGASRMSSVLGLKVRPSRATVLPFRSVPPRAAATRSAMAFLRASLTSTVVSIRRSDEPASVAVRTRARVSLGKQEPP